MKITSITLSLIALTSMSGCGDSKSTPSTLKSAAFSQASLDGNYIVSEVTNCATAQPAEITKASNLRADETLNVTNVANKKAILVAELRPSCQVKITYDITGLTASAITVANPKIERITDPADDACGGSDDALAAIKARTMPYTVLGNVLKVQWTDTNETFCYVKQ